MPNISYTNVSISGYNANPPPDDGTEVDWTSAAVPGNEIKWQGIKEKLSDPLKTALEEIDTNVDAAITAIVNCLGATKDSPAFSADKGGVDQTGLPSGTWNKLTFENEIFDNASDYDDSTSIWTPGEQGKYLIGAYYELDSSSFSGGDTASFRLALYKNGALHKYIRNEDEWSIDGEGPYPSESGACLVEADGNDTFEIYEYHGNGKGEQVRGGTGKTQFWGYRVI
jgi:hypothetical protein